MRVPAIRYEYPFRVLLAANSLDKIAAQVWSCRRDQRLRFEMIFLKNGDFCLNIREKRTKHHYVWIGLDDFFRIVGWSMCVAFGVLI